MKDLAKFLSYLAGVILLGALIAPPLYWGAQTLAEHGIGRSLAGLRFQKFFDRAALLAAFALLWPAARWLRIRGLQGLGLSPDSRWRAHWTAGFVMATLLVSAMALGYLAAGIYRMRPSPDWGKLPVIALSALAVGFVEEALFRGVILGILRRTLRPHAALFWTTMLFAAVHFLKPDERFDPRPITWCSGFALVPHVFHQFAEPMNVAAGFTTLFALGWLCGDAALRTRSLWMSAGLHTGVVFVKMGFAALSKRRETHLPWVGAELQTGLVPVALLILAWFIMRLYLARENSSPPAHRR